MQLVLADDHVLVLDALYAFLKEIDPRADIKRATTFGEALDLIEAATDLDLAILDVNMPGMDGLEGLTIVRRRFPDLPVVLLSGQSSPRQIRLALSLGAAGFIPKELGGDIMIKALQLVCAGETYVPAIALDGGMPEAAGDKTEHADKAGPLDILTPRETQVLALLCEGHSNKSIAREMGLRQATVGYHLGGVFRKMNVSSRTQAATLAMSLGFGGANRRAG